MEKVIFVSAKVQDILRRKGISLDAEPATRPVASDMESLSGEERLRIFSRFNTEMPAHEAQLMYLRLLNEVNRERYRGN